MKRLTVFVLLSALAIACTPVPPDLTFPETGSSGSASVEVNWASETNVSLVFPSSGGTATVAIKATGNWEASITGSSVDWCTFSPSNGASVDTQLKVTVSANDTYMDRNCSITLVCGENRRTVVVTQKQQDALFLTPAKMEVPAEGGMVEVEVRHNTEFSYAVSKSATEWIVPLETRGMTTDKVRFEVRTNPESEPRQGDISFISGTTGETVHVYQEGMAPCIILTQKEFNVGSEGGTVTVELKSNVDFECKITEGSAWLAEDKTRSTVSTHTRRFIIDRNQNEDGRIAKIVFSNRESGLSETVEVHQKGLVTFSLDVSSVSLEADGGDFDVTVTSSLGFKVASLPEWIKLVSTRSSVTSMTFHASLNAQSESRNGRIVFRNSEDKECSLAVSQKGVDASAFNWTQSFYHRSLVFYVTADWCGYCPMMHESLEYAHKQMPDKFVSVRLHGNQSTYEFNDFKLLNQIFKVNSYPSAILDYREHIGNYTSSSYVSGLVRQGIDAMEKAHTSSTAIAISSILSGKNLKADVLLYFKEAGKYKVTLYLTESGLIGYQANYTEGRTDTYHHDDIVRLSLTDPLGDEIVVSSPHSVVARSYTITVPQTYLSHELKILAFTQWTESGSSTLVGPYGNDLVDNAVYLKVGESHNVTFAQ